MCDQWQLPPDWRWRVIEADLIAPTSTTRNEDSMQPTNKKEIRAAGEEVGVALRLVVGSSDPKGVNFQALQVLALKFAEWEGFRDMKAGIEYVTGFIAGFRGETAPQLAPPAPAPGDK